MNAESQFPYGVEVEAKSDNGGATLVQIDVSKHLLTMILCALISGMCLMGVYLIHDQSADRERDVNNKLTISENHWRNLEVEVKTLQAKVESLEAHHGKSE